MQQSRLQSVQRKDFKTEIQLYGNAYSHRVRFKRC